MDWRNGILVCCLLAVPGLLGAQEAAPDTGMQSTLIVIGDVASPGKFGFQPPMTIRDAIAGAHPLSEAVNVTVLRNGQPGAQWTKLIRLSSRDSGEHAAQGDVLVVEALSQLQSAGPRNAAVRTTTGTSVIAIEDSGVVVGDVLQGLGIDGGSGARVAISARMKGQRPLQQASVSTLVQHGDVLSVDAALGYTAAPAMTVPGGAVSEWPTSAPVADAAPAVQYPEVPPIPASTAVPLIAGELGAGPGSAAIVPTGPVEGFGSGLPVTGEVLTSEPRPGASELRRGGLVTSRRSVSVEKSDVIAGAEDEIVSLERQLGIPPVPRELSAVKPNRVRKMLPVSESREVSKLEEPVVETASRSSNFDLAVIALLLTGGIWVFLRTYRTTSVTAAEGVQQGPEYHVQAEQVRGLKMMAAPTATAERMDGSKSVMGSDPPAAVVATPVVSPGSAEVVGQKSRVESVSRVTDAGESVRLYGAPRGSAMLGDTRGRMSETESRLDQLLRNEVPIDEVSPRLPTDLSLFGRAQDLRSYRLDSEHTTIAAPHFERGRVRGAGNVAESRLSRVLGGEMRPGGVQIRAGGAETIRNEEVHGT